MRINCIQFHRLIPWLGIGLVAGGVIAAATYLNFERMARAFEASLTTMDRLIHDLQLSAALKRIHNGEVSGAVSIFESRLP
jgi:CHASE3 domain sensor protein